MSQKYKLLLFKTYLCGCIFALVCTKAADWIIETAYSFSAGRRCFWDIRNTVCKQSSARLINDTLSGKMEMP